MAGTPRAESVHGFAQGSDSGSLADLGIKFMTYD